MSRRRPLKPSLAPPWLRPLAGGYLGEFNVYRRTRGGLRGYFFERRAGPAAGGVGFFVGFLTGNQRQHRSLKPQPPECLVYAFVRPVNVALHRRLVGRPGSLFRQTYDFLEKYTATRPRFEFHGEAVAAIARHVPLAAFPRRLRTRYARNFFVETLALLVRTRLPDYLRTLRLTPARRGRRRSTA